MSKLLVARGAIVAVPPSLTAWPPGPPAGGSLPYRYLFAVALTGAVAPITVIRAHNVNHDLVVSGILDLGCNSPHVQLMEFIGGPGNIEVWVSTDIKEAYQLARVT